MPKSRKNADKLPEDKKKSTSLRLDSKTLKALKLRAIEDETSVQKILETLVEDYLYPTGK
ncbi:hypothetical protein [Roseovarius sp. D22-M7]|uniref:hypothetical protein n=1 Tax=Roseovarius sp. D22-M7 TaxID=3127116 RepID=UPI0030106014